ncbi:MAG: response regulator [Lachnospiraceae bacterium]|nr:response regulator [Lachnospiraceae bacterium]
MLIYAIDDEENVLEETGRVIKEASPEARLLIFNRGDKALNAIKNGDRPDFLFSDIEMPGISGMQLAIRVKELSPDTRIVFTTAYEKYALEAFKVKVQGYLLKPVSVEDVAEELKYLPGKSEETRDKLVVRCFGYFDVYWKKEALIFTRKQSKELLAYLIDREGAACTAGEVATALWQDETDVRLEQNRIRVLVNDLRNTLREIGMEDVLIRKHRELAVRRNMLDCDYYRMLEGDIEAINSYRGQYMAQYSWAEIKNSSLLSLKR